MQKKSKVCEIESAQNGLFERNLRSAISRYGVLSARFFFFFFFFFFNFTMMRLQRTGSWHLPFIRAKPIFAPTFLWAREAPGSDCVVTELLTIFRRKGWKARNCLFRFFLNRFNADYTRLDVRDDLKGGKRKIYKKATHTRAHPGPAGLIYLRMKGLT